MKINATDVVFKIICLMALTTATSGIATVAFANRILIALLAVFLILKTVINKMPARDFIVFLALILVYGYSILRTKWPIFNINELFFLFVWVVLFLDFAQRYDNYINVIKQNKPMIMFTVAVANLLVLASFFFPSSYKSGAFVSFTGAQHRFAASMWLIMALVGLLLKITQNPKYLFFSIIPFVGIILTGARTYMLIAIIFVCSMYYVLSPKRSIFFLTFIPIFAIGAYFVMNSSVMVARMAEFERLTEYYGDPLRAITSGRSAWFLIDLEHFFKAPIFDQLFGSGFHFIREVNTKFYGQNIWAHNDYIQLLGTNGYLGLLVYFYAYVRVSIAVARRATGEHRVFLQVCFHLVNFLNAMLNMLYTYPCATLALPLMLIVYLDNENFQDITTVFRKEERREGTTEHT